MNIILDTHIILWWLKDDPLLSEKHRGIIGNQANICFVSSASVWEISIKQALGKLRIASDYLELLTSQGFVELPVLWRHADKVRDLPLHHRDPFDRLLISQAIQEDFALCTVDNQIIKYPLKIV